MRHSSFNRRLQLDRRNGLLAGVCAGIARHLDVDVTWVRVATVIAAVVLTKWAVAVYVIAWLLLDDRDET